MAKKKKQQESSAAVRNRIKRLDTSANHAEEGGATPTRTLLSSEGDQ